MRPDVRKKPEPARERKPRVLWADLEDDDKAPSANIQLSLDALVDLLPGQGDAIRALKDEAQGALLAKAAKPKAHLVEAGLSRAAANERKTKKAFAAAIEARDEAAKKLGEAQAELDKAGLLHIQAEAELAKEREALATGAQQACGPAAAAASKSSLNLTELLRFAESGKPEDLPVENGDMFDLDGEGVGASQEDKDKFDALKQNLRATLVEAVHNALSGAAKNLAAQREEFEKERVRLSSKRRKGNEEGEVHAGPPPVAPPAGHPSVAPTPGGAPSEPKPAQGAPGSDDKMAADLNRLKASAAASSAASSSKASGSAGA